jgi:flagellar P-ring protein precursor FlgI
MMMKTLRNILTAICVIGMLAGAARAERLKDIVDIKGQRGNPLWGYGIVVGLQGTGDNSPVSRRALTNLLRRSGLVLDAEDLASKNVASVIVTAELGPFSRCGQSIQVTVSTIGSATSLSGGTLLMCPLTGADGQVYAVAQGNLTVGGFAATGANASVSKNHPTVGRIANGAKVEREELADVVENGRITLLLKNADYTTAERIVKAVNGKFEGAAKAVDAGTVRIDLPAKFEKSDAPKFIDAIGALEVEVDTPAVVVINERTGTIVVGEKVSISMVGISHGNLTIVTEEQEFVSQPNALAGGETETVNRTSIQAVEDKAGPGGTIHVVPRQVSVSDLARALNAMGLTPRDLVAIFEALREAGALQAELKIM